jgi:phage major head subunit gpT-like protein
MPAVTPTFVVKVTDNVKQIARSDYERIARNNWWQRVAKATTSTSKREVLWWLLETAKLEKSIAPRGGGARHFDDILSNMFEFEHENAESGLLLKKEQFEDHDGKGVKLAAHWAKGIGSWSAYWPQKVLSDAILANPVAYDGVTFFHPSGHPIDGRSVTSGTFANDFTGAASGIYPGAVPIGGATTVEVALANLTRAEAYISSIKSPDGRPRNLQLSGIIVPPALYARALQLTQAKSIVQSAASGALVGDVAAVVASLNLGMPIKAPELGANFPGGSDSTYYLLAEEVASDDLGAFVYSVREPFAINYVGPETDRECARARELEWHVEGRTALAPGHPFMLFRCRAT